jgi:uncharacterized protein YfaT (DUF1175 family)
MTTRSLTQSRTAAPSRLFATAVICGIAGVAISSFATLGHRRAIGSTSSENASLKTQAKAETVAPPDAEDSFGDGTPDFLRLNLASDQEAFRRWFTLLAEYQALRPPNELPREISDCSALLRYAYRNALREHDGDWVRENRIEPPTALPSIEKFRYPHTPLHAALFRVRLGSFRLADIQDGAFSEFADAKTLKEFNTHLLSRDVRVAKPGDILFFRQLEQDSPFHSMVFVGRSQWPSEPGTENANDIVVYHTGPIGGHRGEMRRLRLIELLRHPSPRWRPVAGNSNFLGVYRWNILRETN